MITGTISLQLEYIGYTLNMVDRTESYPFVSVIVPVYNGIPEIEACITGLLGQSYPDDTYEIIVVDNGSEDGTSACVQEFDGVTLLEELNVQSSYAARNTGIEAASGEIFAFLDSDCTAVPEWIEQGVETLQSEKANLAGGTVEFTYSDPPTAAERLDSIAHMQMEHDIRNRGVAKTANLFVHRSVFDSVGRFPDDVQSGGDVEWTKRATDAGHTLVYAPGAKVFHPARQFRALLRKNYRVGKGKYASGTDRSPWYLCRKLLPPRPRRHVDAIGETFDKNPSVSALVQTYLVSWVCKLAIASGWLDKFTSRIRR
jgi:glycosyltransferase involved in cell wall biosynthesis